MSEEEFDIKYWRVLERYIGAERADHAKLKGRLETVSRELAVQAAEKRPWPTSIRAELRWLLEDLQQYELSRNALGTALICLKSSEEKFNIE